MGDLYCNGEWFRRAFLAGASWLCEKKEILNQLNVFPVPDGDTGTNMSLTLLSAVDELKYMEGASLGEILEAAAHNTLMGARGCSGVIFSQLVAGFAESSQGKEHLSAQDIADGLKVGADRSYKAVTEPVEGTILTVIRESAEESVKYAKDHQHIIELLAVALKRAKKSLKNSPKLLPILAQAGVVDSGGQGFVYMLEGIMRLLNGDEVMDTEESFSSQISLGTAQARVSQVWDNPYCTEFLLEHAVADIPTIREAFVHLGEDLVVVGWNDIIRVHIHTKYPEKVLTCAHSLGKTSSVKIDDTKKQHQHIIQLPSTYGTKAKQEVSIITTAPGEGIKAIYMSLGAEMVIIGDETRNPSVSELVRAIDDSYSQSVLLLPNDKNVIPAALQAASIADKQVEVIPSKNVSQGISALVSFQLDASIEDNISNMNAALDYAKHGEVTRAARDARYDDVIVKTGDVIGMFEGGVRVSEDDYKTAVLKLLDLMLEEDSEVITIFYGSEISGDNAEQILQSIESHHPDIEVEIHYGGHSYCSYILSVE
jgi:hypothetical protein